MHVCSQSSANLSPDTYKERLKLKKLNILTTKEAEQLLLCARGTLYEFGDKTSRPLAHQLKARTASNQITQIRNNTGTLTSDPSEINNIIRNFTNQSPLITKHVMP